MRELLAQEAGDQRGDKELLHPAPDLRKASLVKERTLNTPASSAVKRRRASEIRQVPIWFCLSPCEKPLVFSFPETKDGTIFFFSSTPLYSLCGFIFLFPWHLGVFYSGVAVCKQRGFDSSISSICSPFFPMHFCHSCQ